MGRNNDKITLAKKAGYDFTLKQIKSWGLKFHKLILGKPSYDIIIDDKSVGYSHKSWRKKLK